MQQLRRELKEWREEWVRENGGRQPSKLEVKTIGLPQARTRMLELGKDSGRAELSGSPRRPKTSGPGDAPDEPAAAAAGSAEHGTSRVASATAGEAKNARTRPKKTRRLGRINGGFMPVNRVVPAAKDPEQDIPEVVEPGLASWNRPQEHVAESLALQAQPRGGWKRPAEQPLDATTAAPVTRAPAPQPAVPARAAAAVSATRPRAANCGLPSDPSESQVPVPQRPAVKHWEPGAEEDEAFQEPDWDEIQQIEQEAAEAQSYIEAQQQQQQQQQQPKAQLQAQPQLSIQLLQQQGNDRVAAKKYKSTCPKRHASVAEQAATAVQKVDEADIGRPVRAAPAQKQSAPASQKRRITRKNSQEKPTESDSETDSDGSPSEGCAPTLRARRGRAQQAQQSAKYTEASSESSGSDTGSDFDDEVRKAARDKRKRKRKQAQVRKNAAVESAPEHVQEPSGGALAAEQTVAENGRARRTGKMPERPKRMRSELQVDPVATSKASDAIASKNVQVDTSSGVYQDDDPPTAPVGTLHTHEIPASGRGSAAMVEQSAKPVGREKQKVSGEKVIYDQLGRRRVKWKPPTSSRGGEVSQNFRRLGNVNKKSTNRENALRHGHSKRGGGRGRASRGRGGRGRGRGGSKWGGNSSESGSYQGATSDKHSMAFSADPYGVMGAGKLGSLLLSSPPASIRSTSTQVSGEGESTEQAVDLQSREESVVESSEKSASLDFSKALAGKVSVLRPKETPSSSQARTPASLQPTVDAATEERLRKVLEAHFHHSSFREGQAWAIDRVLRPTVSTNQSTLAILPTGAGKSLCYQVAAFLMRPKVTLVISPLVSLMQDQLLNLPAGLRGDCVTSNQTWSKNKKALEALSSRMLDILFIAPERLYDAKFLQRLSELEPDSVGLICVDEAHCVSQWSHNFRPGYLRLDLIFRKQLGIYCPLLGLTATATAMTERSIRDKLNIPKEGVWRSSTLRPNLHLTVSIENDRRGALVKLLRSEHFAKAKSVIVYAFYRMDVDELTRHLQGQMIKADGYHAGKDPSVREKIQNDFMSGKLHVVVATVAFGMGINKQDVGGVVHYSLPGSMEAYVQEVGRAGRDGNPAYCHLFLNTGDYMRRRSLASSDGLDQITVLTSLRSLFNTNVCKRNDQERVNEWKETQGGDSYVAPEYSGGWKRLVSCTEAQAKQDYDTSIDVLLTCFTYLEIGQPRYLRVLSVSANLTYTVQFFKSTVEQLVKLSPVVNCIVQSGRRRQSKYEFDLASVCNLLRMSTSDLQNALHQLKANGEIQFEPKEQGVLAEVVVEPSDFDLKHVAEALHRKTSQLEKNNVEKIDALYKVMVHFAKGGAGGDEQPSNDVTGPGLPSDDENRESRRSDSDKRVDIQQIIDRYFAHYDEEDQEQRTAHGLSEQVVTQQTRKDQPQQQEQHDGPNEVQLDPWEDYKAKFEALHGKDGNVEVRDDGEGKVGGKSNNSNNPSPRPAERFTSSTGSKQLRAQLLGDISAFCRAHRNAIAPASSVSASGAIGGLTGRAIARIFHGLTSPQYPAYEWGRDPYWGRHNTADFSLILSLANKTVEAMRRKRAVQDKADAADHAAKVKRVAEVVASHEATAIQKVEGECAEHEGNGAVLVFASDSECDEEDVAEDTEDAGALTASTSGVEISTSADHEDDNSEGGDEEDYDSEEI